MPNEEFPDTYKHAPLPWVAEGNKIFTVDKYGVATYHVATIESTPDMGSPIGERASRTAAWIVGLANQTMEAVALAEAHIAYIECVPETEEATRERYEAALDAYRSANETGEEE